MLLFLVVIVFIYAIWDPFRVIQHYQCYPDTTHYHHIDINKNNISLEALNNGENKGYNYDSYIFGSSRSKFYKTDIWKSYLQQDASCYHFDGYSETLHGILLKLQYLQEHNYHIKNVLLIFDVNLLGNSPSANYSNDALSCMITPKLCHNNNFLYFHYSNFKAAMNLKFQLSNILRMFVGSSIHQLPLLESYTLDYNAKANEFLPTFAETQITNKTYYTPQKMQCFYKRDTTIQPVNVLRPENIAILNQICDILKRNKTNYKIVISPLYNQIPLHTEDLTILQKHFGSKNIFNFSGKNRITEDYRNYYEQSHYRQKVASQILQIIYEKDTHNQQLLMDSIYSK